MKPHLTIVSDEDGDWEALYKDGILFSEGHSVRKDDILKALGIQIEHKPGTAGLTGYSFPEKLEDVQYDPDWTETYED